MKFNTEILELITVKYRKGTQTAETSMSITLSSLKEDITIEYLSPHTHTKKPPDFYITDNQKMMFLENTFKILERTKAFLGRYIL